VRGLELAHKRYGRTKWQDLLAPAIRLARDGFPVSWGLAELLRNNKKLSQFPESKRIFLNNGTPFTPGDVLRQPDLAATLQRIAANAADFYEGETARRFAAEMAKHGGEITLADLNAYAAVERKALEGSYRGYSIYTAPPPSAGGLGLLHMLGVLEGSGYDKGGAGSAASIHFVAETMRRYYADRSEYIADPDFQPVPIKQILDPRYIESRRRSIDPERATPSDAIKPGDLKSYESSETTHYSIVDEEGNAVAVTYTLNNGFGSGVTVPGLGFLLNDEMDDFSAKPGHPNSFGLVQGERNRIEPGKRPLSNMTPTILVRDGKLYMVTGTPGGARIINSVLKSIINVIDFKMNMQDAVDWPRFHHQWRPDRIEVEAGISPDTRALLAGRGHTVELIRNFCELAAIRVEGGWLEGAADHRVEGKAAGY
jgi:gamma-glutamyltranspeptidase/glutathione hydrolase